MTAQPGPVPGEDSAGGPAVLVVSSDTHVGPLLVKQLRDYCPKSLWDEFDQFVAVARHRSAVIHARWDMAAEASGRRRQEDSALYTAWNSQSEGHHDVYARLADMDRDGVAAGAIFHGSQNGQPIPFVDLEAAFYGRLPDPSRRALEAEGRRIYNRWLADFCSVEPERHIALCQVPMWDIEASIAEVIWASEHGFKGVNFPAANPELPTYEDPVWEPFFALCAERNMVLTTHISGAEQLAPVYTGPGSMGIRCIEGPWLGRRSMWLLTFTGVFDRHPNLKLVMTELPGAWWADTVREMDAAYFNYHGSTFVRGFLKRKPSEYVATNMWLGASFESRAEALSAVADNVEDRFMWGSDYPHVEGTWYYSEDPDAVAVTRLSLANTFHGLDEGAVRKMVGGNAVECYSLDGDALAKVVERIGPSLSELTTPPDLSLVPEGYHGYGFRSRGAWS